MRSKESDIRSNLSHKKNGCRAALNYTQREIGKPNIFVEKMGTVQSSISNQKMEIKRHSNSAEVAHHYKIGFA